MISMTASVRMAVMLNGEIPNYVDTSYKYKWLRRDIHHHPTCSRFILTTL